jgi:hypothetical protein
MQDDSILKQLSVIKLTLVNNVFTLSIIFDRFKGAVALDYENLFMFIINVNALVG